MTYLSGKRVASGGNLLSVHARVVDANGTVVSDATTPAEFSISGDAEILVNNPSNAAAGMAPIVLRIHHVTRTMKPAILPIRRSGLAGATAFPKMAART
ncbi:MAG: hypothetical protein V4689_17440 [Verrucomicrobiota bacterium]